MKHIFLAFLASVCSLDMAAQTIPMPADTLNLADQEVNVLFGTQKYGRFVGNMNSIKGDDLTTYPALMVNEALAGRLPGLFMMQNNGEPGENSFTSYIRGNVGGYITLIDGVERPLGTYDIDQIEEIRVLKDPVSKALYGGRTSNGIIMITTKRGKSIESEFKVNVQGGIKMPSRLPGYLNSYDFATRYNQALANDNISVGAYTQEALNAYKNHSMPYKYPDVDYYDQFLNNSMNIMRVNAEYYGGNERTVYFIHGGYQNEGGLEAYGDKKTNFNAFTLQGNLDTRFSDKILLHANAIGYIGSKQSPGDFKFETLSSRYPNAYPILVGRDSIGGTSSWRDNPYAEQTQKGYRKENLVMIQADLGLEFKLDAITKGLSFKPAFSMDIFHNQQLNKIHRPAIYNISSFDSYGNPLTFNTIQTQQLATSQSMGTSEYTNRWAFTGIMAYERQFDKHQINTDLVYYLAKLTTAEQLYDNKIQSLGLRANYTFNGKYTVEGVLNYTGTQSLHPDKRFKIFPAAGVSWLASGEEFLKDVSWLDYLKLNASWGIMGDGSMDPNLWRETWSAGGDYSFNNSLQNKLVQMDRPESKNLSWPKQREIDLSIEANILKHFYGKLTWFDYLQTGMFSQRTNLMPGILGGGEFLPYVNFGETALRGIEVELAYAARINKDMSIRVGTHLTYSKSERKKVDELPDPDYSTVGLPNDAILGYKAIGTYTQAEIDAIKAGTSNLALPSYMDPNELKAGNIKYADINGDKVLNKYDTKVIGNSTPRIMYGLDLTLNYKGFELNMLFSGYGKYDRLLNNTYYQVYSTRKYSDVLVDGLPNGNPHPMLTTSSGTNDFQTSDYWIVNGSFLKLRNAALSYTLPNSVSKHIFMKNLKFSLYGTNLLTFSKIKASDPESLNAGINQYPLFTTLALGFSATF
ncbi:SusC/RagA family TonB-linked outer membrane protein [Bacteroides xylanisolvens]|uniref:SusC/RagA family TonB-linked outer membrane protein n=1 Tax=Bacteroides xylanisolvens TaxID=371601 RepID=UPI00189726C2|nr:SusC/RagA family TonB-linked outer membrane protein [Bacteroides xylanisolvens]